MKHKKIIITACAALLILAAGCETATTTPEPVSEPIFEALPTAAPTEPPAPVATPEPELPMLEGTDLLLAAFENLGIEIDPTKHQSVEELVVFVVKLLGREDEALKRNYQHPYGDVSQEASPYVGYAYATWLLTGKPGNTLGAADEADAPLLLSMLMRGMGYNEDDGEETSGGGLDELVQSLGLSGNEAGGALRGDELARIMWAALSAKTKNGDTLAEQLIDEDVFSSSDYREAGYLSRGETPPKRERRTTDEQEVPNPINPPVVTSNDFGGGGGSSGGGGGDSGGGSGGGGDSGGGSGGGGGDSGGSTTDSISLEF